ncbi:phage major capsid protein [Romboutsia lituseburensis]|uniref:phage major capsid protein n=1 Tax=Romboutsia lituseburensis TaxID=1537 RepID=UPI0022EB1FE3|nr:phage major capsid protein [Romboutsia lituseburensis]
MNKELREMLEMINNKKAEARELVNSNKIEDAKAMKKEIEGLQNKFDLMKDLYEEEMDGIDMIEIKDKKIEKVDSTVAFNKAVLGKPLTEAQAGLVEKVGDDGGYLVPVEQKTQIEELKRELIPLKELCNVIPVGTLSGSMPLEVDSNDELTAFDEVTEINQSSIKFGQVKFELSDYGDIIPVSNTLLQDEKANLTTYVGKRFAKKAVRTENKKILTELAKAGKVNGNDYLALNKALNIELDPAISASATIITNQDGYDYLDGLVDGNGRPLLTDSLTHAGAKEYKGKRIVVLSNQHLVSEEGKWTFFVGDIAEYIAFFDRQAYEMAVSQEAGFTKNATFMRVIERFDVKKVDSNAVVCVEITKTVAKSK